MKFYLGIDTEGKKQLRGTKELILKVSKTFEIINIPTGKEGLEQLVQDSFDRIFHLEKQIEALSLTNNSTDTLRQPAPAPAAPAAAVASQTSWTATEIEDFILNKADVNQCANIHSCLGTRFGELVKETNKLRD